MCVSEMYSLQAPSFAFIYKYIIPPACYPNNFESNAFFNDLDSNADKKDFDVCSEQGNKEVSPL